MITEQMERMLEELKKKGLHVSSKEAVESLKQLKLEYSDDVSINKIREITGRVYRKKKKTLSDEIGHIRRRG